MTNDLKPGLPELDFTKLHIYQRAANITVNQPPNTSQKEYLRKHSAESKIILSLAKLFVKERVTKFIFSPNNTGATQSADIVTHKLDIYEFSQLSALINKAGVNVNLTHIQPTLFHVPLVLDATVTRGVIGIVDNQPYLIDPIDYASSVHYIESEDFISCMLFCLFYFTDQLTLLEGTRARGQTIPRFLHVYASHSLNQIIFDFLKDFTKTIRFMILEGLALDSITLSMIGQRMAADSK